jgi:Protein of unknown function (DUF2934)
VTASRGARAIRLSHAQQMFGLHRMAMILPDISASTNDMRSVELRSGTDECPSQDEIARLAYDFYNMRGRQDGHDVEDWLRAERELGEIHQDYREYA